MGIMKKTILALILLASPIIFTGTALAYDAYGGACDGSAQSNTSSVCTDKDKGTNLADPNNGMIPKVANVIAAVGGIIAVVYIMINGLGYITSTGDGGKAAKSRDGLIYAAVGLAVIIVSRSLLALILRYL